MSEYAEEKWQDCRGDLHNSEEEALLASRRYKIEEGMKSTYVWGSVAEKNHVEQALAWFLNDPKNIIAVYEAIERTADSLMKGEAPCKP